MCVCVCWIDIYLKLLSWDLAFDELGETGFKETHKEQRKECEAFFSKTSSVISSAASIYLRIFDPDITSAPKMIVKTCFNSGTPSRATTYGFTVVIEAFVSTPLYHLLQHLLRTKIQSNPFFSPA